MQALKTSKLLVPTSSASPTPTPLPTVIPNIPFYENIEKGGAKTLWVVFAVMFLSTLTFMALSWRVPVQKRLFHVLVTVVSTIATISYFAMAVGDGNSYTHLIIKESHKHVPNTYEEVFRQIFWARYVDWALTTPLILLSLGFLAGMSGASILVTVVADLFMVALGLFAAYGVNNVQKWGYYGMACVAYLIVVYQLVVPGRRAVLAKSNNTAKLFASIGGFTLAIWALYPIVWAIGDGARIWSVDAEIIAFAVLDILAKPVFGFWLLFSHAGSDQSIEGFWSHGLNHEGGLRVGDED